MAKSINDLGLDLPAFPVTYKQPEEPTGEITTEAKEAIELCRTSLDFLASISMPTIFQFGYPPVFQALWNLLLEYSFKPRDFSQLALGLPRGFGKSTFIKLYVLFCILFTNKQFILVFCATAKLAENIISDVADFLDEPNIQKLFGSWKVGIIKDTQELKVFGFRGRNIILQALGAGSSVRGINIKNIRPDVMLFDDVQTREQADSETQSTQLLNWMLGTAMKAKSPHGCLFIFIGNMYPTPHSILRKLKHNPLWIKFICGGILADGTSLWEDLQPIKQLIAEYENNLSMGKPEIFASEVLNDENASANNLIIFDKLPPYPFSEVEISAATYLIIDPATDKVGADAVSLGMVKIFNGKPVLREVIEGRLSPKETIIQSLKLCMKHECYHIFVESNAYQYTLKFWFDECCQQLGIQGIEVLDIYSGKASKNSRILAALKLYQSGDYYIHPDARAAVHSQIRDFKPLKTDNTDGLLDILTYMTPILTTYGAYIASTTVLGSQDYDHIPVLLHNSLF